MSTYSVTKVKVRRRNTLGKFNITQLLMFGKLKNKTKCKTKKSISTFNKYLKMKTQ